MNLIAIAAKIPAIIQAGVIIHDRFKNTTGRQKKEAVIKSIPEALGVIEDTFERDIFNDPAIMALISAANDAEAAALKAREALQAGILNKSIAPKE